MVLTALLAVIMQRIALALHAHSLKNTRPNREHPTADFNRLLEAERRAHDADVPLLPGRQAGGGPRKAIGIRAAARRLR
jgi:hypothetical protein